MEQQTGSKLGKEYVKAVYFHPTCYLLCRVYHAKCQAGQSTSWNQDCQENINNLRYADDTNLMEEREEELKSLSMKVKEESKNVVLKFKIRKLRSWHLITAYVWLLLLWSMDSAACRLQQLWPVGSVVGAHAHLLFCLKVLYLTMEWSLSHFKSLIHSRDFSF